MSTLHVSSAQADYLQFVTTEEFQQQQEVEAAFRQILDCPSPQPLPFEVLARYREKVLRRANGFKVKACSTSRFFVTAEPLLCVTLITCGFLGLVGSGWLWYSSGTAPWLLIGASVGCLVGWIIIEMVQQKLDRYGIEGLSWGWAQARWSRTSLKEYDEPIPAFVSDVTRAFQQKFPDLRFSIEHLESCWKGDWEPSGPMLLGMRLPNGPSMYLAAWDKASVDAQPIEIS